MGALPGDVRKFSSISWSRVAGFAKAGSFRILGGAFATSGVGERGESRRGKGPSPRRILYFSNSRMTVAARQAVGAAD